MKISMDEIAVAQFGNLEDEELKKLVKNANQKGIHWYYFDKTADEEFELNQLCEHYKVVFKCYESKYMEKIK
jgi:hypothetical protein